MIEPRLRLSVCSATAADAQAISAITCETFALACPKPRPVNGWATFLIQHDRDQRIRLATNQRPSKSSPANNQRQRNSLSGMK